MGVCISDGASYVGVVCVYAIAPDQGSVQKVTVQYISRAHQCVCQCVCDSLSLHHCPWSECVCTFDDVYVRDLECVSV